MESSNPMYAIISVIAMVVSPLIAVQVQKVLEERKIKSGRKEAIFKTLMATRASKLSQQHVEALNLIDLEFGNSSKSRDVIDAWKIYFDHLCQKANSESEIIQWNVIRENLFTDLLYKMSKQLKFNFDVVTIKRNCYTPIAYENTQKELEKIRDVWMKIGSGEKVLTINLVSEQNKQAT